MNWDLLDFLVFGTLVTVFAIIMLLVRRMAVTRDYRIAATVAATGAFLLVWVNGAVGIAGNEENDANILFFGVLAVAVAGSVLSRFRARGMAITLYAMVLTQLLAAVLAMTLPFAAPGHGWPHGLPVFTAVFSTFWLVSGWLFGRAARRGRRLFSD